MAKTLLLQHKEALEKVDAANAKLAALEADRQAAVTLAQERAETITALETSIADLTGKLDAATERDEELCQELANAKEQIAALEASAQTVTTAAADRAATIVAEIGVPPVAADDAAQPSAGKSIADLTAEYQELLKADTRAAGEFYHTKLAPALRKENQ